MKLRARLKADAEKRLDQLVRNLSAEATEIGRLVGAEGIDMAKLVCMKRNASLRTRLINRMADKAEDELIEKYNDQMDISDIATGD